MPEESQTITLPVSDWQTILAGLYELPGKFGIPVLNRLQAELTRPLDVVEHFPRKKAAE